VSMSPTSARFSKKLFYRALTPQPAEQHATEHELTRRRSMRNFFQANALQEQGRIVEAIDYYTIAINEKPSFANGAFQF